MPQDDTLTPATSNTLATLSIYTGVIGELSWADDTKDLYVHDGITAGGIRIGGETLSAEIDARFDAIEADIVAIELNIDNIEANILVIEADIISIEANIITINNTLNSHIGNTGNDVHGLVTQGRAGFMSKYDKRKLDSIYKGSNSAAKFYLVGNFM